MKRTIGVLCLLLVLFAPNVSSADIFCREETSTVVVFGNGILNTQDEATSSRETLERILRMTLSPDEFNNLEFDLAYNKSYGFFADLYESLKQRLSTDNVVVSFWRWLGGREEVPDAVREELLKMATRFDFSTMVGDADLANHLILYRTSILAGKKVLVVSHSQGNFFVNAAYQILYSGPDPIQSRSFGIVSVANPASFVGGNGPYTTLVEDGVIAAIALASLTAFPAVLPPLPPNLSNIFSNATTSDWRGHNFVLEYMAGDSRSVAKIVPDIIDTMNGLEQPMQIVQDGIITITLTWGAEPDVDLHVFEPNGFHVYWPQRQRQGVSGYLDLDDVTSYGPEHYYVSCSTLETGTYRIGVNYFYGLGPETAHVQIEAGTSVRNFTIPLSSSIGSAGDAMPIPVADVAVSGNSETGFQFNVLGVQ